MTTFVRTPARPSIHPHPLNWQPILPKTAQDLSNWGIEPDPNARAVTQENGTLLYLRTRDQQEEIFVKIVPRNGVSVESASFENARLLFAHAPITPKPLWQKALYNGSAAFAYRLQDGEHPKGQSVNYHNLGLAIRDLHDSLQIVLDEKQIRAKTTARISALRAIAAKPSDNEHAAAFTRWQNLANKAQKAFLEYSGPMMKHGQIIHGDLNPGNIIASENKFVFIDLEDTQHSFLWPGLDLAKIAERLIVPEISTSGKLWAKQAWENLNGGYYANQKGALGRVNITISQALMWHMGLAICLLKSNDFSQNVIEAELSKFSNILGMLKEHEAILNEI